MGRFKVDVSARIKQLPPYLFGKLNAMKYQKRRAGVDIIDLGMGNPSDPTPEPIVEKLCDAVRDPRNHRYSDAIGLFNLRREVAKHYAQRYGVELDPESEIICIIGSKEGFSHLCLAMLENGDLVVVPAPAFPIHQYAVGLAGAATVNVAVGEPERMLRDIADAIRRLRPRPKMLVLNFPHNPTTTTVDLGFFKEIVPLARRYNVMVAHDFAYAATAFDGYVPPSFLQVRGAKGVGVEFTTMSKEYNMAGWRVGYCVGNRQAIGALARIKGYFDYGISQPVQIASIIALRHCGAHGRRQAEVYQRRRDVLCEGLNRIGWPVEKPKATMFVWVPIPDPFRKEGSVSLAMRMMEEAEVAVSPGAAFGEAGEGHLRLAIVENEKRLRQAVRQIGRAFRA